MSQNKNSNLFFKDYSRLISLIILVLWIVIIIVGIMILIIGILNQHVGFIWLVYFSNLISLVPYALMFFPTLNLFIEIRDIIENKKFEENL
ncbi:MAG: hypothetical protein ACFE94_19890, partial [Candidatus Hodarchaeota archaeon]